VLLDGRDNSRADEQLVSTAHLIKSGKLPSLEAFRAITREPLCVVITYGEVQTINGPFSRKRIVDALLQRKVEVPRFVVLSVEELDGLLSLVERGHELDEVIGRITGDDVGFNPLHVFQDELRERAVSTYAASRYNQFFERMFPFARARLPFQ